MFLRGISSTCFMFHTKDKNSEFWESFLKKPFGYISPPTFQLFYM